MTDKSRKEILKTLFFISVGIIIGVIIGMFIQQMIFIVGMVEIGESLGGTNVEINVDLNETKLVEGFTGFFDEGLKKEVGK